MTACKRVFRAWARLQRDDEIGDYWLVVAAWTKGKALRYLSQAKYKYAGKRVTENQLNERFEQFRGNAVSPCLEVKGIFVTPGIWKVAAHVKVSQKIWSEEDQPSSRRESEDDE